MASRIVALKTDVCAVAYYVAQRIGDGRSLHGVYAQFTDEWDGRWHWSDYALTHDDFHISCHRNKHEDGRIRNAYNHAENTLNFALWCVQHNVIKDARINRWAAHLQDWQMVTSSVPDAKERKALRRLNPSRPVPLVMINRELHRVHASA